MKRFVRADDDLMVLNWLGEYNQFDGKKKQVHQAAAASRERNWDVGACGCLHLGANQ
jgi:hypothetical protein